jgi:hypothetical protein
MDEVSIDAISVPRVWLAEPSEESQGSTCCAELRVSRKRSTEQSGYPLFHHGLLDRDAFSSAMNAMCMSYRSGRKVVLSILSRVWSSLVLLSSTHFHTYNCPRCTPSSTHGSKEIHLVLFAENLLAVRLIELLLYLLNMAPVLAPHGDSHSSFSSAIAATSSPASTVAPTGTTSSNSYSTKGSTPTPISSINSTPSFFSTSTQTPTYITKGSPTATSTSLRGSQTPSRNVIQGTTLAFILVLTLPMGVALGILAFKRGWGFRHMPVRRNLVIETQGPKPPKLQRRDSNATLVDEESPRRERAGTVETSVSPVVQRPQMAYSSCVVA